MKYNYFQIEDTTYAYTTQGRGEPIVLLHGFTGSSKTWEKYMSTWTEKFQVITIDLPGHGKTVCHSPRTMKACCDDVQQLLIHLQIKKCHLLGYSMGGRTALSFAMWYPEFVSSLLLESASPGLQEVEERKARLANDKKLAEKILTDDVALFVQFWENIPLFQSQKNLPEHVQAEIRVERLNQSKYGLAESLLYMGTGKQPSWWQKLDELVMPILLIVGEIDEKFVQLNKRMQEKMQDAELAIVKNAGHAVHVEQVEKFAKIVMEFIEENNI